MKEEITLISLDKQNMKEINYLKKADKVYLVAPSFGCTLTPYKERLENAIKVFKDLGYEVIEGKNIYLQKGHVRSNTEKECAKEIMSAFESDAKVIFSVGGGETMIEILEYVNFSRINKLPPKLFICFSDNTNLTFLLTILTNQVSVYGPCFPTFGNEIMSRPCLDTLDLITNKVNKIKGYPRWNKYSNHDFTLLNPLKELPLESKSKLALINSKEFNVKGIMLGGCLDILTLLCGTKYDKVKEYIEKYKDEGIIWYLEACDLSPLGIERSLFQLKEAGWFKHSKGFIFGKPLHYDEKQFNVDRKKAVTHTLKKLKLPIVLDVSLGHYNPSLPILNGKKANCKVIDNELEIEYLD